MPKTLSFALQTVLVLGVLSFLLLTGCATPASPDAGTAPPATSTAQTIASDAVAAVGVIHTVVGDVSTGVATACAAASPALEMLGPQVKGGAANTLAAVKSACTSEGQVALTANDAAPVTPTNSGNSPAWVKDTTAALQIAAAVASTASSL